MERWLRSKELAGFLGVQPDTVRRWARAGMIPAVRISRRVMRFEPDQVVRALRRRASVRPRATRPTGLQNHHRHQGEGQWGEKPRRCA
jgi:excisionase family DNA binding protein